MKSIVIFLFVYLLQTGVSSSLDKSWWKHAEIYDIEIGAFKDSDGDGFGDLEGITSKLDYIKGLGFSAIKMSNIFSSTEGITLEYGIEDFTNIYMTHGTIQDFDRLMEEAQKKDIKVILDFPINHCSTSHEWFKKSQQRIYPYTDYFIWKDPFKANTTEDDKVYEYHWEWDDTREESFYYFHRNTADLNLRNIAVREEVKKIIKFWLDKGVSGLNLLFAHLYIEDPLIRDAKRLRMEAIANLPESYDLVHELREYVDVYNEQNAGHERILMLEYNENKKYKNLRGNETFPIAHIVSHNIFKKIFKYHSSPLLNYLFPKNYLLDSDRSLALIQEVTKELKNGPTLFISECVENYVRLPSLFKDKQLLNTWIMLISMTPGTLHFYYGQEIGLDHYHSRTYSFADAYNYGSSMQWDDSLNAGFTSSEFAMIPPNINYWNVNVKKFKEQSRSTYHMVEELVELRKTETVMYGDLKAYNVTELVFAFSRSLQNEETYFIVFNYANVVNSVSLYELSNDLPDYAQVAATTPNALNNKGEEIDTRSQLFLAPSSSIVLKVKN